jgi:DNA-binding transcriptional MerR regulator
MFPFSSGKKKEEAQKVYIPVDLVLRFCDQGLSEPEIIARLEQQGFPQEHIDKALRIALKEKVISGAPPTPMEVTQEAPEAPSPIPFGAMETPTGPVPIGEVTRRPMPMGYPPERLVEQEQPEEARRSESQPATEITVEEIIEAIVEERWKDFENRLEEFEKRDFQLQSQIDEIRKKIVVIEAIVNEKEKTVLNKLEEFGESVTGIEGRIGGIERVFKDFLPELTTNIKTMSDLVEKMKKEKESN